MFGSCMQAELPNLARRADWSSSRRAMYLSSKPSTHFATSAFWNFLNSVSSPAIRRDSMSDVLDCMSELATFPQSSMLRTEWPTFSPMSHSGYSTPSISFDK